MPVNEQVGLGVRPLPQRWPANAVATGRRRPHNGGGPAGGGAHGSPGELFAQCVCPAR